MVSKHGLWQRQQVVTHELLNLFIHRNISFLLAPMVITPELINWLGIVLG